MCTFMHYIIQCATTSLNEKGISPRLPSRKPIERFTILEKQHAHMQQYCSNKIKYIIQWMVSECQLSILLLEGKRAIKRQLYSKSFTL